MTGSVGVAIGLLPWGLALEERIGLSWLFHLRGERAAPDDVVIVSLDKESSTPIHLPDNLQKWPRSLHAELVSRLAEQKPAVIVFDVSFRDAAEEDPIFAKAIRSAGNVVLAEWIEQDRRPLNDSDDPGQLQIRQAIPPAPALAREAAALAAFPLPKVPVRLSQYWRFQDGNPHSPTLPVAAFHLFTRTGHKADRLSTLPEIYRNGESAYLNFYGPPFTFTTIPFYKILNLPEPVSVNGKTISLKGKAVFIGLSETSPNRQRDGFYTVFSRSDGLDVSGVEIAATAFANLLEDRAVVPLPPWAWLPTLLVWGVGVGTLCSLLPLAFAIGLGMALPLLYLEIALLQFSISDRWFPLVIPIVIQAPFALFGGVLSHYFKAREIDRLKSEAVMQLSHDIRSPLASAKGYLENLRDRIVGDLTDKQANYLDRMSVSMEHLNRMVHDQLNLSQIESGTMTVRLAPLSMHELLSEQVALFRPIFTRKGIRVWLQPFEEADVVAGDRDKMDRIFTNLLDNALKFTPEGGEVVLTCQRQRTWLEISIRDSGIGIPAKEQAKIFSRFHQVQGGQPSRGKGAGLGLFIVKQLVELQGGAIRVRSTPGKGSEFILSFPLGLGRP